MNQFPVQGVSKGTFRNETATLTTTAKNNSKYNNCTLECIKLGTDTELSLKLECEKTFFRAVETTRM